MLDANGSELSCPRCSCTDICEDHIKLRVKLSPIGHKGVDGALLAPDRDYDDFPIIRCQDCGNIAFSESALVDKIPELADKEIVSIEKLPENFHELN